VWLTAALYALIFSHVLWGLRAPLHRSLVILQESRKELVDDIEELKAKISGSK
jgi:uncharacterized membrane protein YqjE